MLIRSDILILVFGDRFLYNSSRCFDKNLRQVVVAARTKPCAIHVGEGWRLRMNNRSRNVFVYILIIAAIAAIVFGVRNNSATPKN